MQQLRQLRQGKPGAQGIEELPDRRRDQGASRKPQPGGFRLGPTPGLAKVEGVQSMLWAVDVDLSGYRTFREAKFGASFEGVTQVGLGVRARLPFRVSQLPDRLVVDVAHTW
ncbi:hypothetical protein ACIOHS_43890 [Streptomyces sp. NPDC088253]|uniref:AMIN-like domain-containing (lipo)protein n=1 Tax=Streptomyces sp. NPDC088253 TaxID=3365846 RepID=UPI003810D989